MKYTEEQFEQLEQDERVITDEAIAAMLLLLASTQSDLERELHSFYQRYGKDGVVTYSEARKWSGTTDHRKRLTVLLLYINENFDKLSQALTPEFKGMLADVIDAEKQYFETDIDYSAMEEAWGADEKTWDERLEDDILLWSAYIAMDIKQALVKQQTIDDLIAQIDGRFVSMGYVLNKLGLTESTAVGSIARKQLFKELGITKYQFYSKADERTCEVCGGLHGLTFPMTAYEVGVTASPLHPRCRCWEIPIRE